MRSLICTSAWWVSALRVWLFRGRFPVTPSSYIKLVRAVYRQRIYYYLVQYSGMLHCWLQRYHSRIKTFESSLIHMTLSPPVTTCHLLSYLFKFFKVAYIANNMDPDQTARSLIRFHIVCFHEKSSLKCTCRYAYFQACCIAGYRDITPGSELSDHPSYIWFFRWFVKFSFTFSLSSMLIVVVLCPTFYWPMTDHYYF